MKAAASFEFLVSGFGRDKSLREDVKKRDCKGLKTMVQ